MERSSKCAVCYSSFRASICVACVNRSLHECKTVLDSLKSRREVSYSRLSSLLVAKERAMIQQCWMDLHNEKLDKLRDKLELQVEKLQKSKSTFRRLSSNLKERYGVIESTNIALEKSRVRQLENHFSDTIGNHYLVYIELTSERLYKQALVMKQICKLFPLSKVMVESHNKYGSSGQYDQICNAVLPQGLNPLSVPPKELAASLGYMVQLLNLVVHKLAVPALHNLGFGGSCSRIWQRESYWKSHPSSSSDEYPLFVPSHDYFSVEGKSSWTGRDTTNFGVTSLKSDGSVEEDYHDLDVVNLSSASPHSVETFRNVQRGIAHLKQSVAHLTVYGYSSLSMEVPSGASTFETFAKLLNTLSSIKEVQSALSHGLSRALQEFLVADIIWCVLHRYKRTIMSPFGSVKKALISKQNKEEMMSSFSPTQLASLRDMGIYEPFQQLVSWGNVYKSDINDHSPNTASSSVIQVDARVDDHNNIVKSNYNSSHNQIEAEPCSNDHQDVDDDDDDDGRIHDKMKRRLAQNREAARKSRLRKKAYVQQLEESRLKLSQLEQELERAKQQGLRVSNSIPAGSITNTRIATFEMEHSHWLEEQSRRVSELRIALQAHISDIELRMLVESCLNHYANLFRMKSDAAKADVFYLISGMWRTCTERFFQWIGGFRPSELLNVVMPYLQPLTDQQVLEVRNLQQSSQQAEDALSQGIEKLQQSLVENIVVDAFSMDYPPQMAAALENLQALEGFVNQADHLRQQTLQQMAKILTTRQSARGLLALGEYLHRLRALSSLWAARPRD
ncbi:unnamed protein product [Brassica rapa]|uniref:DOG1 domain-containing protein n=1 Tax=Brassica campestris TaxID=3711 RepID=A0A8D9HSW8_BRACM|nr:unnamed protein product [Brassica rapa]